MNELIRKLIEQAHEQKPVIVMDSVTCEPTHKIGNGGVPMYHSELNPEKFAELIVRECLEQIDDGNSDHAGGNREAIDRIKEHFGVEQ